jgi:choice-of-anchor C domain-containing protein
MDIGVKMEKLATGGAFAIALFAAVAVPLGGAQAVTVINGSFEDGINPGAFTTLNSGDSTSIAGWTVSAGNIDYIGTYWTAADGSRSLDMNGLEPGSISQTLTGLTIGQQYKVSFELAGNPAGGPTLKTIGVTAGAGANTYTFDTTNSTLSHMGWVTESFFFTADGTTDLLTFASTTTGFSGNETYPHAFGPALDDVSITATPLPAALPLFAGGIGLIGLIARRRKRKAQVLIATGF